MVCRKTGGIRQRLWHIAGVYLSEGKTPSELARLTGLRIGEIHALKQTPEKTDSLCVTTNVSHKMQFNFRQMTSREELLDIPRKNKIQLLQQLVDHALPDPIRTAAGNGQTNYLWETTPETLNQRIQIAVTIDEVMEAVRARYPGCSVYRVEEWVDVVNNRNGVPPTRVLKSGIKIDWS